MENSHRNARPIFAAAALCFAAALGGPLRGEAGPTAGLALQPTGAEQAQLPHTPVSLPLKSVRPKWIRKEPVYRGVPKYAVFHLGDGPNSTYTLALDEPADGDYRIYLDRNRDGDLTNDGDGTWARKHPSNNRMYYGANFYSLRASWGAAGTETSSGDYGVTIYQFTNPDLLVMYRTAARVGMLTVEGAQHRAILVENDADGLFNKQQGDDLAPLPGCVKGNPAWLLVDLKDTGKFSASPDAGQIFNVNLPFAINGTAYEAKIPSDGSAVTLAPTSRPLPRTGTGVPAPPPLRAGTRAPNFLVESGDGKFVSLADYSGKIVLLDFWATWCGPCQRSMPHLDRISRAARDQGVVVLGICSWDTATAFHTWVQGHRAQYGFTFAFDPAAKDETVSIATRHYGVPGLPTTYLIGRDGLIAGSYIGFDGDGDRRIEEGLVKLGVKLSATP